MTPQGAQVVGYFQFDERALSGAHPHAAHEVNGTAGRVPGRRQSHGRRHAVADHLHVLLTGQVDPQIARVPNPIFAIFIKFGFEI